MAQILIWGLETKDINKYSRYYLCDVTLYKYAYNFWSANYYNRDLIDFYSITKGTNVYNSEFMSNPSGGAFYYGN